jgi:SAM-dependent methyltransferase
VIAEGLAGRSVLDVGTGTGRLALALAAGCRRVVGIDQDARAIEEARRRARAAGLTNAEFAVVDAEAVEYGDLGPGGPFDLVVAHLCVSDAIIERSGRALAPGHALAFVAFHVDQWRETGRRSRFAYEEDRARAVLEGSGFAVERLQVEQEVKTFRSVEEGLAAAVGLEDRWRADGRWFRFIEFLEKGGRTLTRSHLVARARKR